MSNQNSNVVDIFEYLEANGFKGSITAQDRESSKTFLFSDDGIFVLSKGKRKSMRLYELLRKEGKIDRQTLEDALVDERESNYTVSFDQLLLRQNEITDSELEAKLKYIVENELYDLLLWKEARFNFDPSATRESTFKEGDNYTYFLTEAVEFGQTFKERIDNWDILPERIPSLHTIYKINEEKFDRIKGLNLNKTMLQETQLLGENSLGDMLDKTKLTKPELCMMIFLLLKEKIIHPLPMEEAKQRATQLETQQSFDNAATYYAYVSLSVDDPEVSSLTKLASLLDKGGRKREALQILENEGWNYYEKGNFSKSLELGEFLSEFAPGNQAALTLQFNSHAQLANEEKVRSVGESLGALLMQKQRWKEAEEHYKYLLDWFEDDVDLKCALADAHLKTGNREDGLNLLIECAEKYEAQGKRTDALQTYNQVLYVEEGRSDIIKRVKKLELVLLTKKFVLFILPVLIVVGVAGNYVWNEYIKGQKKADTETGYIKIQQIRDSQLNPIEVKKETKNLTIDRTALQQNSQSLRSRIEAVIQAYMAFSKKYPDSSEAKKALEELSEFAKEKKEIEDAIAKAKLIVKKKEEDEIKRKIAEKELIEKANDVKDRGIKLLQQGKYKESRKTLAKSFKLFMKFYKEFPGSERIQGTSFRLPALLDSVPRGARVSRGGKQIGITPMVDEYSANANRLNYKFEAEGFKTFQVLPNRLDSLPWDKEFIYKKISLTMSPIWVFTSVGGPVESGFYYSAGHLYYTSRDGGIYALTNVWKMTPVQKWIDKEFGYIGDFLTAPQPLPGKGSGIFFVATTSGHLVAYESSKRRKLKIYKTEARIVDAPTTIQDEKNENRFYVAVGNLAHKAYIYSVTILSGKLRFSRDFTFKADHQIVTSPLIEGDFAYISSRDNRLVAVDFKQHGVKKAATYKDAEWVFEAKSDIVIRPMFCMNSILVIDTTNTLYSIDKVSGKEQWRLELGAKTVAQPLFYPRDFQEKFAAFNLNLNQQGLTPQKVQARIKAFLQQDENKSAKLLVSTGNKVYALPLLELIRKGSMQKALGRALSLPDKSAPISWIQEIGGEEKSEGNIAFTPMIETLKIRDKMRRLHNRNYLFVTTERGVISSFDLGKKPIEMLQWKHRDRNITSPPYIWRNLMFIGRKDGVACLQVTPD